MRRNTVVLFILLCVCDLYGSQPVEKEQKKVEVSTTGALGHAEATIHAISDTAFSLTVQTLGYAIHCPRLTFVIATVIPLALPGCRGYVGKQTCRFVNFCTRLVGQMVQQRVHDWFLGSYDKRIDDTQQSLDKQSKILDGNTSQLTDLQSAMDSVSEDTQLLLHWRGLVDEKLLKIYYEMHQNTGQIQHVSQQLDSTAVQINGIGAKLDGQVIEGTMQNLQKIEDLERRLEELSSEQRQLFAEYGGEFNARLDKFTDTLCVLIGPRSVLSPVVRCGQQHSVLVKQ